MTTGQQVKRGISSPISRGKTFVFWVLTLLVIVIFTVVLEEGMVRLAGFQVSDDPYIQFGRIHSFFTELQIDGRRYCKVTHREVYRERNIQFPREKEPGTFRVFCLGGSASAGWPHPPNEIYSAYLQKALQQSFPDRKIEVINVSAHAYAAYRVRLIFKEVVKFQPDLIILYSGNNEFLERRIYSVHGHWYDPLQTAANESVVYRLARGSRLGRRFFPENTLQGDKRDQIVYEQWSKIQQLALDLRKDPQQFQRVKEHYAFSIHSIVQGAKRKGVPVIIVTVPVNLRDWLPNVSYRSLHGSELARWEESFRRGRAALLNGDPGSAIKALRGAIAMDREHAASHFYLAHALETKGNLEDAFNNYSLARDLDYNPFRAVSDFNKILRQIPQGHDNVFLADAEAAFRSASAPYAPGFDLFLDYVHPTKRGNLILAETVFDVILHQNLVGCRPAVSRFPRGPQPFSSGESSYYEETDFGMQSILVELFTMMHQNESAIRKAKYLVETPGALDSVSSFYVQIVRGTLEIFPEVVELERREILGMAVDPERRERLKTRLLEFYRQIYAGYELFRHERGAKNPPD